MAVFVPAPAVVGGEPERLAARWGSPEIGQREPDFQRLGLGRIPDSEDVGIGRKVTHLGVDGSAVFAGPRFDWSPVAHQQWQGRESEVGPR